MSSNKKINNNLLIISEYMDKLELDNCRLRNSDEILNNVIEEKDKEIERLNNIIKEVREYIENNWINQKDADIHRFDTEELEIEISDIAVLYEILDKETK